MFNSQNFTPQSTPFPGTPGGFGAPTPGLFSPATPAGNSAFAKPGGSLFGGAQQQQQRGGGSMFGAPQQQQAGAFGGAGGPGGGAGGLFGQPGMTGQGGTNLFGAPQSQQAGLFGGSAQSSLFGGAKPGGSSLFGGSGGGGGLGAGSGLFGGGQAMQSQPFNAYSSGGSGGMYGGGMFGSSGGGGGGGGGGGLFAQNMIQQQPQSQDVQARVMIQAMSMPWWYRELVMIQSAYRPGQHCKFQTLMYEVLGSAPDLMGGEPAQVEAARNLKKKQTMQMVPWIDARDWQRYEEKNPDPLNWMPCLVVGIEALHARVAAQAVNARSQLEMFGSEDSRDWLAGADEDTRILGGFVRFAGGG
jgi:hypothetical protein